MSASGEGNRGTMSGRSGKKKMSKLSRSARAGVIFPVGRLMRYLKKGTFKYRISVGAPVYMAAVIEYLAGRTRARAARAPAHGPWGELASACLLGSRAVCRAQGRAEGRRRRRISREEENPQ